MSHTIGFCLTLAAAFGWYAQSGLLRRRLAAIDAEDAQRGGL